jgi:hypothetical protein
MGGTYIRNICCYDLYSAYARVLTRGTTMKLMVQLHQDAGNSSMPRYVPSNTCAIILAEMMRVDVFTTTALRNWIKMGGTVAVDGKEWHT